MEFCQGEFSRWVRRWVEVFPWHLFDMPYLSLVWRVLSEAMKSMFTYSGVEGRRKVRHYGDSFYLYAAHYEVKSKLITFQQIQELEEGSVEKGVLSETK